jgi:catechol 2,3-dioxygenase-like lactoylglutathione lyase family enzyme
MQGTQLRYVIKFVADMDKAVKFCREVLGLTLKFESPGRVYDGRNHSGSPLLSTYCSP